MSHLIWVGIGGFAGAIARYAAVETIGKRISSSLPAGTLFVNLLGAFLLGLLYGSTGNTELTLLIGTGFMGAFTTFSTLQYELLQFSRSRKWRTFAVYVLISTVLGLVLFWLGSRLGVAVH